MPATSVSGTFAVGTVGNDPPGNVTSNYGAFTVSQTSSAVSLVWTPCKAFTVWQNVHFGQNAGAATASPTSSSTRLD